MKDTTDEFMKVRSSRMIGLVLTMAVIVLGGYTHSHAEKLTTKGSSFLEAKPAPSLISSQDSVFVRYSEHIGESLVTFEMIPIDGGTVVLTTSEGEQNVEVAPFWISKTEVTWDAYDIFAFQLDLSEAERIQNADAKSRPSRPYEAPDYGFGHQGYAAMSVTYFAADQYTKWLSEKTGITYRLATEAEWQLAAQGGEETRAFTSEELEEIAWYRENAGSKTHPVASKKPNAFGLYDMFGNVQEWVTGYDGEPVTRGGSYRDQPEELQYSARETQSRRWNERDPQIPKSKWWLSDGPFVGFRIVRAMDK